MAGPRVTPRAGLAVLTMLAVAFGCGDAPEEDGRAAPAARTITPTRPGIVPLADTWNQTAEITLVRSNQTESHPYITFRRNLEAPQPARAAPATPPVIRSGVLLGLQRLVETDRAAKVYETLWIAGDGDSVAVLARGPGLLVPRSDGFWWVNAEDCNYIVAGPAATWPEGAVSHGGQWAGAIPEECPWENDLYEFEIFFVGPNYISVRFVGDAPSGRAIDSVDEYYVMSLDSLRQDAAFPVETFFPPSTLNPLFETAVRAADSLRQAGREECGPPSRSPPRHWSILHGRGHWGLVARFGPSSYPCMNLHIRSQLRMPEELVGDDELFPDWAAITAVVPNAVDAVSSPGRDMIVARTRDSLFVYHLDGDVLGQRALAIAERGSIVMAQWALGRHVQRWTNEVWELLSRSSAGSAR